MSTAISPRPRFFGAKHKFTVVASQFNAEFVKGLIDHVTEELRVLSPGAIVNILQVPGAFEIPIVVRELAFQKRADAIIAVGVILKGETGHADNLGRSVTDALQRIAVEQGVPVVNAVLNLNSETQARERCLENEINRGTEAARAAVQIANVMADLRSQ